MAEITAIIDDANLSSQCRRCGARADNRFDVLRFHPVIKKWFVTEVKSPEGWGTLDLDGTDVTLCPACQDAIMERLRAEMAALARPAPGSGS
jgi:hypothetical protein